MEDYDYQWGDDPRLKEFADKIKKERAYLLDAHSALAKLIWSLPPETEESEAYREAVHFSTKLGMHLGLYSINPSETD